MLPLAVSNTPPSNSSCKFHSDAPDMLCLDCIVVTSYPLSEPYSHGGGTFSNNHTETPNLPSFPTSPTSTTSPAAPAPSADPVTSTGPIASITPVAPISPIFPMFPTKVLGANNMSQDDEEEYMRKMHSAMQEMDKRFEFVPDGWFLDLGCCPGGFSTHVLHKWPSARGVGVSLPPKDGGHSLAVPNELRSRLEVHWADITMFNLTPQILEGFWDTSIFTPVPIQLQFFDFVMVDGHQPPHMTECDPREPWSRDRLLLSQLLIALRAIKPAGTLLVKLSLQVSIPLMERVVLALSRLSSAPVQAIKPESIYATKATFYILVRDLDVNECSMLAKKLEGLWYFMTLSGPDGFGRCLNENDLDQIATSQDVRRERQKLKALFDPIEEVRKATTAGRANRATH